MQLMKNLRRVKYSIRCSTGLPVTQLENQSVMAYSLCRSANLLSCLGAISSPRPSACLPSSPSHQSSDSAFGCQGVRNRTGDVVFGVEKRLRNRRNSRFRLFAVKMWCKSSDNCHEKEFSLNELQENKFSPFTRAWFQCANDTPSANDVRISKDPVLDNVNRRMTCRVVMSNGRWSWCSYVRETRQIGFVDGENPVFLF